MKDNFERFDYIKNKYNKTKIISQFDNYSKIFSLIIDLDRYYDKSENIYNQVEDIIKICLSLNIKPDKEDFTYIFRENNKDIIKFFTLEEMIHLKNKIFIKEINQEPNENKDNKDGIKIMQNKTQNEENDKRNILINFKKLITNLEIINDYKQGLRNKGSSLPIQISIKVENLNEITYHLSGKLTNFEDIKNFLFKSKENYNNLLNSIYKENLNLRFLYGKQFSYIMKHLVIGTEYNIDSFLRYILNITDSKVKINEGFITINRKIGDYLKYYQIYEKDSFENISNYITSLFINNNRSIDKLYDEIKMRANYKGIYFYPYDDNSAKKIIIDLFLDKLSQLPISQNVLITSKETSYEEIQAFFHRAILCNYNSLFVVEINDTLSEYQQTIMINQIFQLLLYKKEKCNQEKNKNYEIRDNKNYLNSCIVFVLDVKTSFSKEINIFIGERIDISENLKNDFTKIFKNIHVITSEICGLGKSCLIRKKIKEEGRVYFRFPLGGILTKNIIFNKLNDLFDKIRKYNYKYNQIAIHLDLTESREKSILNEFFFSFLITKFYSNDGNIIYIPNDVSIYIEIPNCFEDYLSKFGLLKIFNIENITFNNIPSFNFPKEIIKKFDRMLDVNNNEKLRLFVEKNISIKKYSYYQINIFIKIFISQFDKIGKKLILL